MIRKTLKGALLINVFSFDIYAAGYLQPYPLGYQQGGFVHPYSQAAQAQAPAPARPHFLEVFDEAFKRGDKELEEKNGTPAAYPGTRSAVAAASAAAAAPAPAFVQPQPQTQAQPPFQQPQSFPGMMYPQPPQPVLYPGMYGPTIPPYGWGPQPQPQHYMMPYAQMPMMWPQPSYMPPIPFGASAPSGLPAAFDPGSEARKIVSAVTQAVIAEMQQDGRKRRFEETASAVPAFAPAPAYAAPQYPSAAGASAVAGPSGPPVGTMKAYYGPRPPLPFGPPVPPASVLYARGSSVLVPQPFKYPESFYKKYGEKATILPLLGGNPVRAFFDTETTGFAPLGRVIELSIIIRNFETMMETRYYSLINPETPLNNAHIHGIESDVVNNPGVKKFKFLANEILAFIGDHILVAHNAEFDQGRMNHEFKLAGYGANKLPNNRFVCTLRMADAAGLKFRKPPSKDHKNASVCAYYGVTTEGKVLHSAEADTALTADMYTLLLSDLKREIRL